MAEKNIIFYGSNMIVANPKILINGYYKDFGYGFYCTNMEIPDCILYGKCVKDFEI
jgi:hypothetical protein